jgi:hypothetical protein
MKKRKKRRYFNTRANQHRPSSSPRTIEMEPEELAVYVRRAEQIIKELKPSPGAAQFLLAQYTQVLATGNDALTPESAMVISNAVLALWKEGYYTPGPEYPYTLEETIQEIEEGPKAKGDYAVPTVQACGDSATKRQGSGDRRDRQTPRDEPVANLDDRGWALCLFRCLPGSGGGSPRARSAGACLAARWQRDRGFRFVSTAANVGRWRAEGSSLRYDGLSSRPSSSL